MCHTYIVEGRVQGVFYRASAREEAVRLGLHGWVRNLPDGRVESFACGDAGPLREYERWLRQGPRLANVTAVSTQQSACTQTVGFEIT
ncbi:MAG: acylphosphatase [Gammaproteobacteria bacterium]